MVAVNRWIWRARRGRLLHLADPVDPVLTLCGIEADRIADPEHQNLIGLRCGRCRQIDDRTRQ